MAAPERRFSEHSFEEHRAHLLRVGYRITGRLPDAEDAVQEAWLRYAALDDDARAALLDERAWLTTVVGRLCLDRLRSAAGRREQYVGPWLPDPLLTTGEAGDPLTAVVRDEGVRMAAMVVLERLNPPQRVAFVLHDALAMPFAAVASMLSCTEEAARQHASRARRIVADATPPPPARNAEQRRVVAAFAAAVERADGQALVALLHPDAVWLSDAGGLAPAARRPIVGAENITRLALGLAQKYGGNLLEGWELVDVNGEPGIRTPGNATTPPTVAALSIDDDGRIVGIYQVVNPEKLGRWATAG
jgi:RNA polymerase sigma-70 factor (ECF subfamily)